MTKVRASAILFWAINDGAPPDVAGNDKQLSDQ